MHRLALILTLLAACDQAVCPEGSRRIGSRCVLDRHDIGDGGSALNDAGQRADVGVGTGSRDGSTQDAAHDANFGMRCPPENHSCPSNQPVCGSDGFCTFCARHEDCARFADTPACAAGACVECSADNTAACPDDKPVCDTTEGACVQCTEADQSVCAGLSGKPVCKEGGTECVECNADDDCKQADASRCVEHQCKPCQVDADCAAIMDGQTALDACLNGVCVDCRVNPENTREDFGCTGNFACNPATNQCTNFPKNSVDTCGECVADSQCTEDRRCVEMFFGGMSLGGFCLKLLSAGCVAPYLAPPIERVSLSGATATQYCGISEGSTSCAAIRALEDFRACAGGNEQLCGAAGALCRTVNGGPNVCTYACNSSATCPEIFPCRGPDNAKYCGGPRMQN